jgi:hypothetical protein
MNIQEVEMRALPYVQVLHAFCVVDPTLCAPVSNPSQFVVTLQPYLKSQVDFISLVLMYHCTLRSIQGLLSHLDLHATVILCL